MAVRGQERYIDHEIWTGPELRYKLNDQWRFDAAYNWRINLTAGELRQSFTEVGAKYSYNDWLAARIYYRHADLSSGLYRGRVALQLFASYKEKGFPIRGSYRMQFERNFRERDEDGDQLIYTYWRNRISLEVNVSKLVDPFVAFEYYHQFDDENRGVKNRFTMGLDWRVTKDLDLSSFLRIQDSREDVPLRQFIYGFAMTYDLKFDLKKENKLTE